MAESLWTTDVAVDTLWTLVAGILVFFMNAGFGCVEAGFCRAKNAVNILAKNFVVFGISSLAFFLVGWAVMFGDGNGFLGWQGLMTAGADNSPAANDAYQGVYGSISWTGIPLLAKFFFQLVFAGTAATIVSGCIAERIHYRSFMIFTFVLVALSYPITGHWIWGGGWLANFGMWDFAGSTVVHSVGGWAGLAGILLLGPRIGKYREGRVHPIPGHSMALAFLGGMILWLGWFGFNPGSTMGISGELAAAVSHIVVTTNLACAAGLLAATITAWVMMGKPDFSMTVNGALAGLVSITAPCAFVSPNCVDHHRPRRGRLGRLERAGLRPAPDRRPGRRAIGAPDQRHLGDAEHRAVRLGGDAGRDRPRWALHGGRARTPLEPVRRRDRRWGLHVRLGVHRLGNAEGARRDPGRCRSRNGRPRPQRDGHGGLCGG